MSLTHNAIAYAQFRLKGGWRNIIFTAIVYAVLVGGAVTLTVSLARSPGDRSSALNVWLYIILGIQSAVLAFFGGTRISAAIQADTKQRMFESHRVMSMSSAEAVLGYLVGAPVQAICLAVMNVIIGSILCLQTGIGVTDYLLAHAAIILTAAFLWVIVAMVAFISRAAVAVLYIGMGIGSLNFLAALLFPAVLLLITPIQRGSTLTLSAGGFSLNQYQAIGLLMQVAIGTICFVGAMRKYRWGDELPALGPWLGLCLMILFAIATVVALTHYEQLSPGRSFMFNRADPQMQFVASSAAMMLLACIPISGAARMDARRRRRRAAGADDDRRFSIPSEYIALGATAVTMGLLLCNPSPSRFAEGDEATRFARAALFTAIDIGAFLLTTSYLWRIMIRATTRVMVVMIFWLLISWLAPFIANVVLTYDTDSSYLHAVSGASPIGALILTWGNETASPVGGLIYQVVIALVFAVLYYSTGRPRVSNEPAIVSVG